LNPGQGCPGGRGFNYNAFSTDNVDANGNVIAQGNAPRNLLRGFPTQSFDLTLRRDFPIYESLHLQFRADAFNLFNHPSFGPEGGDLGARNANFGVSSVMINQYNQGSHGFSSLYAEGGPRSLQLSLKLVF